MAGIKDLFSYNGMRMLASHANSRNMATQALAVSGAAAADLLIVGTAQAIINGLPVTVAAENPIDLSNIAVCDKAGETYTSVTVWFLVVTDGTNCKVLYAGQGATPKYPDFDAETYVAIGDLKIVCGAGGFTVGTTTWDDVDAVETFRQITWPVFPHQDNVL